MLQIRNTVSSLMNLHPLENSKTSKQQALFLNTSWKLLYKMQAMIVRGFLLMWRPTPLPSVAVQVPKPFTDLGFPPHRCPRHPCDILFCPEFEIAGINLQKKRTSSNF